jgi:carboxyvinyl-carboxyphosphonate phosphorylmutase
VMRCVAELERAGVAALTLEDTLLPARFEEPLSELISVEEAVGKLRAAQRARQDRSLALIARTHAGVQSLAQVIQRTRAYQDTGADAICLIGVRDLAQLEAIVDGLRVPVMMVTYGAQQHWDEQRLAGLGVRIVVDGHAACFAAIKATYDTLRAQRGLSISGLVRYYRR